MLVKDILARVRHKLQDTVSGSYRWSDATLVDCYNEALLWHVQQRPDTHAVIEDFTCLSQSEQALPDTAYRLLGVLKNNDSGRVIVPTTRDSLSAAFSNWYAQTGTDIEQYFTDERTPRVFWIYPKPTASRVISIQISKIPTPVTEVQVMDTSSPVSMELPLVHLPSMQNYMLFAAYMDDAETEGNLIQAQNYLKLAANDLGLSWNIDLMFSRPVLQGDAQ